MGFAIHPSSTCDICEDSFDDNEQSPSFLACGHIFCRKCLLKVAEQKRECPNCRASFSDNDIKKIYLTIRGPEARSPTNLPPEVESLFLKIMEKLWLQRNTAGYRISVRETKDAIIIGPVDGSQNGPVRKPPISLLPPPKSTPGTFFWQVVEATCKCVLYGTLCLLVFLLLIIIILLLLDVRWVDRTSPFVIPAGQPRP